MITSRKPHILIVAGARPNFVKIAPLMRALRSFEYPCELSLVHTGQHYDEAMSGLFFDQLQIPRPDVSLGVGSGSHAWQTAEIMIRFEPIVIERRPDVVVVVGDVNSTVACALVSAKLGIRVAHVEAGLRSFDRSMPEEINRILTDALSNFLFVTEPSGVENLRQEGIHPDRIFLVGNVMIDSLQTFLPVAQRTNILEEMGLSQTGNERKTRRFALVTLHRPSNVDDKKMLGELLEALSELGKDLPVIFPAHPRTLGNIRRFGLSAHVGMGTPAGQPGVWVLPPAGYLEFLHLLSEASLVLTDSGGIQEETTALGIPCLTLRENTERPITVTAGTNHLVGRNPTHILAAARKILAGHSKRARVPEMWDGLASKRIVSALMGQIQHSFLSIPQANPISAHLGLENTGQDDSIKVS